MLGNADARDLRLDRLKLAAVTGVSVGLGIEGVELAHAAGEPEMDHRNVAFGRRGRLRTQPQHVAPAPETEDTQGTNSDERAPIEAFHSCASVVEQKLFRIEDRPENVFERSAPGARPLGIYGLERDGDFTLVWLADDSSQENSPYDVAIGERGIRHPLVEMAAFGCGLLQQRFAADQMHGLGHIGLGVALADDLTGLHAAERCEKI